MKFAKENPLFTAVLALCVVISIAGAVLGFLAMGKVGKAEKQMKQAENQYRNQLIAEPSPTLENVEAVKANIEQLNAQLDRFINELKKGGQAKVSYNDDVAVFPLYIDRFRRDYITRAQEISERVKGGTEEDPRSLFIAEDNFFGFQRFRESPPPAEHVDRVYLQTLVVQYMLDKLFATIVPGDDVDVISILREPVYNIPVELKQNNNQVKVAVKDGMFIISDIITAKSEGAIDTMAFKIIFNGRTNNLRGFLKALATEEEWPLVVRSVEVEPAEAIETRSVRDAAASQNDIFALFGGGPTEAKDAAPEDKMAEELTIVDNTVSKFTITLEYIEILKPDPDARRNAVDEMPVNDDDLDDEAN